MIKKLLILMLLFSTADIGLAQEPATEELRQWAAGAIASSQYGDPDWSPAQATGAPDTTACADSRTAWASRSGSTKETLTLTFDTPVIPSAINIHQTYTQGSIIRVSVTDTATLTEISLPNSADPVGNTPCPGVFSLAVSEVYLPVNAVTIYLDESIGGSWNEIDAVELVGEPAPGAIMARGQWGSTATATSQYGDPNWSAKQATGAPDVPACGDYSTAWASATSTGKDSLTVGYEQPMIPVRVNIFQSYNPGAITSVSLSDGSTTIDLPKSADPAVENQPCPDVLSLPVSGVSTPINSVTINLDQTLTGTLNEIDAVQLVGYALTETFTTKGGLSLRYPQNWAVLEDSDEEYIFVGSSQTSVEMMNEGSLDPMPPGEVGIGIALPSTFTNLDLDPNSTPLDLITGFAKLLGSTNPVDPYPPLGENAVITQLDSPDAPAGAALLADTLSGETVLYAIQFSRGVGYDDLETLLLGILSSVNYQP